MLRVSIPLRKIFRASLGPIKNNTRQATIIRGASLSVLFKETVHPRLASGYAFPVGRAKIAVEKYFEGQNLVIENFGYNGVHLCGDLVCYSRNESLTNLDFIRRELIDLLDFLRTNDIEFSKV